MAYSSDITTLVNPPLPVDPARAVRNIQVLKKITASPMFTMWVDPAAVAEIAYHEGDSPAVVDLKLTKILVEWWSPAFP